MGLLSSMKDLLRALTVPAEDPRQTEAITGAITGERHQDLLLKVRQVRAKVASSINRLESTIAEIRANLSLLEAGEDLEDLPLPMRQVAEEELYSLERQLEELQSQERVLPLVERRLVAEMDLYSSRRQALEVARDQAAIQDTLDRLSEELADLGEAVERADQKTEGIHARTTAMDPRFGVGMPQGRSVSDTPSRRLARRYAKAVTDPGMAELKEKIGAGLAALQQLASEHAQLLIVLERRKETEPLVVAYVPALAGQTYDQGLKVLEDALDLASTLRSPGKASMEAKIAELETEIGTLETDANQADQASALQETVASLRNSLETLEGRRRQVDGLIHQAGRCEAALHLARMELAGLKVSGSKVSVDAVTESLLKTIQQAIEVQEDFKRLGLV